MDLTLATAMLLMLSPLLLAAALAVRLASGKPVIFRQSRVGRNGREFQLLKFRTMAVQHSGTGPGITSPGDPRITGIGKWLRRSKLDELPQLVNVLRGEMTLVGPRPDLKEFWRQTSADASQALQLTPGLTGPASVAFRNEEDLFAHVSPEQVIKFYVERLLPAKAKLDLEYASEASFLTDCGILLRTLTTSLACGSESARNLHEQLSR